MIPTRKDFLLEMELRKKNSIEASGKKAAEVLKRSSEKLDAAEAPYIEVLDALKRQKVIHSYKIKRDSKIVAGEMLSLSRFYIKKTSKSEFIIL